LTKTFEAVAVKMKDGNVGVWTDGVMIQSDHLTHPLGDYCFHKFVPGNKYKITIEKI
jgi:hypothetical protein